MPRLVAAAVFGLVLLGASPAWADVECYLHCDYTHDYGPYDFTYKRPGLYGFPRCGPYGDCSPYLSYTYARPRQAYITVRTRAGRRKSP